MNKADAEEAAPICNTVLTALLAQAPTAGTSGAAFRQAVNSFRVNALTLLRTDQAGPPLESIFRSAQTVGVTFSQMEFVRNLAAQQAAVSVGAILVRDALIQYALVAESSIASTMTFISRDDVENLQTAIAAAFGPVEETIADDLTNPMMYQAIIGLHAAVTFFLVQIAQPLPRMLDFMFASPMPTLTMAYKLYADASRADELRDQNHVVHPAFMLPTGRALSQ